jgi:hypothetical protein
VDDVIDSRPDPDPSSDINRDKKTVPLVCSEEQSDPEERRIDSRSGVDAATARTCGAVLAEVFMNRARRCVDDLRARGAEVTALERIVETVQVRTRCVGAAS